jgi:mono/diheme cytochrome c family protein
MALLRKHCVECHGPEKQKGDLRLDTWPAILAGGENGPAIVPGKPMDSLLVELITLSPAHDDAMPPKGKPSLTGEEILTLVRWIEAGAKAEP